MKIKVFTASVFLLLCSCAPTTQPTTSPQASPKLLGSNPVFAEGQQWKVSWGDGQADLLTVPPLESNDSGFLSYSDKGASPLIDFTYHVNGGVIKEYAEISIYRGNTEKHCIVIEPPATAAGTEMTGMFYTMDSVEVFDYTTEGKFSGPTCKMSRIR